MLLIVEPFYGGSHRQLVDFLSGLLPHDSVHVCSMTAKKWHWRARTAALSCAQSIPSNAKFGTLFCSSVLNLAELIALRPDLAAARKVIYFHENQLAYPVRKSQERDFQYGYNQILSALVADVVVFNSSYNMDSFLSGIAGHFKLQPDYRPTDDLRAQIEHKCRVLYFPVRFPDLPPEINWSEERPLCIVWPHRWEHDKNPEAFFDCVLRLKEEGFRFRVCVLGESFTDVPDVFHQAKAKLTDETLHWGFAKDKSDYWRLLRESVPSAVVSTAHHEFFGVAMLEAAYCGCFPLVPQRLVYPELFPEECVYRTDQQLYKRLRSFCKKPALARERITMSFEPYSGDVLQEQYRKCLHI